MNKESAVKTTLLSTIFISSLSIDVLADSNIDKLFSMDLEQLMEVTIETASKVPQKTVDAAAVIQVINQQDIQSFGANSLYEVLGRATSLAMCGTFFFPQNTASMRGGSSTGADHHVLLLLNGRPMRDSFTGGENFAFYTAFPIQLIKQIEIIRGPGSVLYGSNAFTGVINIITQEPGEAESQVTLSKGSFNTTKVESTFSVDHEDLKLSAGFHWLKEDGWDFAAIDNNGVAGSFDAGEKNISLVATGDYKAISFDASYFRSKQNFWGTTSTWSSELTPPSSNLEIQSTRLMLDVGYQFVFDDNRFLEANISHNTQEFTHINYDSESKNTLIELTHHWKTSDRLNWLMGGSVWHQDVASYDGARVAPVPAFSQNWLSVYSQAEFQQTESLKWIFGAQVNKVPDVKASTVPRLGAIYQTTNHSGFKLNYGEAFRAAYGVETHFDLVICCREDGSNRGGLRGNPTLKPETIATLDVQYYHYDDQYQFNLTVFKSKQEDLIERERAADNVIDFLNRGELNVEGVELEYKYTFSQNSQLVSSFSYQKNQTGYDVENFTLTPNRLIKLGYTHNFENKTRLAIFNSYSSDAYDNLLRYPNRNDYNPEASAHNMLTANIKIPLNLFSQSMNSDAYLELYAYNLLDEDIYQPEIAGGQINTNPSRAGRSWYLSFTMPF